MTNEETIAYFKECNEKLVSVAKDENVYDYEKQVIEADCMRETFEANEKAIRALEQQLILDKIRAEIVDCLKALDNIEKSGLNIYLPNEMSGRRLTYQQCLDFIDKYKAESEDKE